MVIVLLTLMYFITYLDRVNVSTAAAGYGKDFGLNKTEIGLVFSAFAYPYLLFQIIGGWVSDRFGARRTLLVSALIWAAATLLTGLAGGLASMLAARLLLGLGEGATFPAATSAMSRWVPKGRSGFAQGITHAGARVGNALAPAIIVTVMSAYDWRVSFYACGIISLVWIFLWAITFTEHPQDHPRITQEELDRLPSPKPKIPVPWWPLFKRMWPVTVVYFCYGWTLWLFLSWIPQYFLHSYNLDLKRSALFASSVFFSGVLGDTLGGIISDWIYRKTGRLKWARSVMVTVAMALAAMSILPILFVHDVELAIVCLSLGFFFAELCIGPMWAIPMDIAPHHSGTASGMMNTGSAFAAIVSPVISGLVIDATHSWELPFFGSMLLMVTGMMLCHRMDPESPFEAIEAAAGN
ncbi:MAG: MFS transporter [Betaproteobacteria bacterium]|nr:MFS transporter [Betaproteobacteria bacterium]